MERHAALIRDSSEVWPDRALVTSKAKPDHNGVVTLFISRTEILGSTNLMVEVIDEFTGRSI